MGALRPYRDSRHGKFRELPHFPAIPAAPIRGGKRREGKFRGYLLPLVHVFASLGAYFSEVER